MKAILVATILLMGLVGGGAAYARDGGACVKSPGAMPAYARPDEPKHAPKTGKQIQVKVEVQPKPPTDTVRQPTAAMQPARDDDGPLRIGSELKGMPTQATPAKIALGEPTVACNAR